MSALSQQNNKRIAKNTLLLYFCMLFSMGIGLFTSRIVLESLGIEDYGIYNLVGGIVTIFAFLNSAMIATSQRFISYELGKGNLHKLKDVFCTTLTIHIAIAFIIVVLSEVIGVWFLNTKLNIPSDRMMAANWTLQLSIFVFAVNVISVPYNASIVAHEKMSAFAYISIFEVSLKLAIAYLLLFISYDKLIVYSKYKVDNTSYLSLLNNVIDYMCQTKEDYFKYLGYRCLGPLLWGYIHWLIKNFQKEDLNKIYFFARDGLIMKKAFDIVNKDERLKSYYLEVSRRSLRVPILWNDPSFINLLTMLSPSKRISLKSIFDGVGLNIIDHIALVRKYGYDLNSYFYRNTILEENRLMLLYNELQNEIILNSKKEFVLMCEYMKQMHVEGRFAVVDIGWSGGMQRFLQKSLGIIGIENEILGYYTGVADYYKRNMNDGKLSLHGYLFDFYNNVNSVDKRSPFVGLYETLFLEQKGSVKNYIRDKNEWLVAERYDYEYQMNGELQEEYYIVEKIQSAALDFINDIEAIEFVKYIPFTPDVLFANLKAVGLSPSRKDLKMLAKFRFFDEGETFSLVSSKSFIYYVFNPRCLKNDLLSSKWKIGFLKCLLKIPFPYFKLYKILKNRN